MGRPNRAASGALGRAPLPVPVRLEPAGPGWGWVTGTRGHRWPWSWPVRTSRALGGKPQGIWGPDCPLAGNVTKWRAWGGIWGDIWGRGGPPSARGCSPVRIQLVHGRRWESRSPVLAGWRRGDSTSTADPREGRQRPPHRDSDGSSPLGPSAHAPAPPPASETGFAL